MLAQLRQSVDFRGVAGVALGVFKGCESKGDDNPVSIIEVFQDRLGGLGVPLVYGLTFGHIKEQFTIPLGIKAELDADNAAITFLETAVT